MKEQHRYSLGCGFAWWVIHIFFRPFECVELAVLGSVDDRIAEFSERAEGLASWLLDEVGNDALVYRVEGKRVSIFAVLEASEPRVKEWMFRLIEVVVARDPGEPSRRYADLYCLMLGWQLHMAVVAQTYLDGFHAENAGIRNDVASPFIQWLREALEDACRTYKSCSSEDLLRDERVLGTYEALAADWRRAVDETLARYLGAPTSCA
ncbi:hypothetical protein MYSTI_07415 [Myxococcus stipitatus DSM 14675]|uniref:Uncharacterized protein n=1 Tax=Myxococcus stipitatus (strain DSM 14675 / JCM 12634 / Mx s8) TaxID=1278073 RepID=L7UMA6_MYXSD|nr:hypothetical protein [Myxococcus stipitatus]AGC48687.1 hypothetical protein MYSTI_07415 [Myxococcus stipitatus DSM 14675]